MNQQWRSLSVACALGLFSGLVILGVLVAVAVNRAAAPDDTRWRAALQEGNGNDWVALSAGEQEALCAEAAKAAGKGRRVASLYCEFLNTFYASPNEMTRQKPISEALGVCQTMLDKGAIRSED